MSLVRDTAIAYAHRDGRKEPSLHDETRKESSGSPTNFRHSIFISSLSSLVRSSLGFAGCTQHVQGGSVSGGQDAGEIEVENRKQIVCLRMRNAVSYDEWRKCACELDELENNIPWKYTFESDEYQPEIVQQRLKQLEEARLSCDVSRMLFLIRTGLSRDLGDMSNASLYRHSYIGTKDLIDRYIIAALDTISALVDLSGQRSSDALEMKYILDQLLAARQAFGRSALLFSGGATFGMYHIGVLKSLWQAKLLPRIVSGASAGSIVCAIFCTRTDDELPSLLDTFPYGNLAVFNPEGQEENLLQKAARFLKYGSFMDISNLANTMRDWLGDITFQEAYNRTRRILNICVSSAGIYELPKLLNYITAPNVMIWSAIAVSCSVPFVFRPFALMAKDSLDGEPVPWNDLHKQYIDGSVDGDLPMTRLSEIFNVNHFIVSQVNPHVLPFIPKDDVPCNGTIQQQQLFYSPGWFRTITHLAKDELLHRMTILSELGIFTTPFTKVVSIVNQKYFGDINIYPEIPYSDFALMLKNPTTEFMLRACIGGERATWPKLSRIRNHCAIELALDSAIQTMRARVAFSPSQVDLRMKGFVNVDGGRRSWRTPYRRRSSYNQELERNKRIGQQLIRRPSHNLRKARSTLSLDHYRNGLKPSIPGVRSESFSRDTDSRQNFNQSPSQKDGAFLLGSESDEDNESFDSPQRQEFSRRLSIKSSSSSSSHDRRSSLANNKNSSSIRLKRRVSSSSVQQPQDYFSFHSPSASKAHSPSSSHQLSMTPAVQFTSKESSNNRDCQ